MVASRAAWRGFLKVGSVSCGVKIIGAVTEAEKIHFRILNRKDGLPVRSAYVDEETGETVDAADQLKGYEVEKGEFIQIDPDEIKELKLVSHHTLDVECFVPIAEVDTRYLEKPYYLVPADAPSAEAFAVIREAMARKKVAARSCVVLYQRGREVLIQPEGNGMLLTELRNRNEVISAGSVFEGLNSKKVDPEMLEIAQLLVDKKPAEFDPSKFEDTYENALIAMIDAKRKGKKPPKAAPKPKTNVVNLADILRKSLAQEDGKSSGKGRSPAQKRKSA